MNISSIGKKIPVNILDDISFRVYPHCFLFHAVKLQPHCTKKRAKEAFFENYQHGCLRIVILQHLILNYVQIFPSFGGFILLQTSWRYQDHKILTV